MSRKNLARSARQALQEIYDLGLTEADLSHGLGADLSASGLRRKRQKLRLAARNPRLLELLKIFSLAKDVYGRQARQWFLRPEPKLGYVLPATLLRDPGNGPSLVRQVLYSAVRGNLALPR